MIPTTLLLQGDCLELLSCITDASVALALTDPPYGTTACKWDAVIPFEPMWAHLRRVLKGNAPAVIFSAQPFTSALVMSNVTQFKYQWVWKKNVAGGFAQAKNKPMPKHEDISVFSTGKTGHAMQCKNRVPYNPQGIVPYGKEIKNSTSHRASAFEARKNARSSYVQEFTGYPDSILEFDCERQGIHPTQKPVALMEYLIRTYTNEGETVLDFTMGSGTTGVACMNTGRNFIGIERDEKYFQIASERIENAKSSTFPCSLQ